jgi:phosphatidylserine decarboxylase
VWQIDANSSIALKKGVAIKSGTLTSIVKLIGEDSQYKNEFASGIMTHTFLDIQDYHRFHFPVSGVVKEIRNIAEQDAVGGIITWDPSIPRYMLDCTVPSWQAIETRGCIIIDTEDFGLEAILPIGMSQICSVKFEDNIHVGTVVKKGDMMGCFLFGGSDIVMLFQQKAGFIIKAATNGQSYQHILMGEKYGELKGLK